MREDSLETIWDDSPIFTAFRGTGWMKDPCRTCDRRELDFGGCRCQAAMLAGDARAADPVCAKSPQRDRVDAIIFQASGKVALEVAEKPILFRTDANSRALAAPKVDPALP